MDNLLGILVTLGILGWFGIMIYLKVTNQKFDDVVKKIMELIKRK